MNSASDYAYNFLKDQIAGGLLSPGDSLREETIAKQIGTSRTPVREAIRRLGAEGFVEVVANKGATVLGWQLEELREVFALRGVLEAHAAHQAATLLSRDDLSAARQLAGEMTELAIRRPDGFEGRITALNNQFHSLIVSGSGNRRLTEQLESIMQIARVKDTFSRYSETQLERSMRHHSELIEAIDARDPEWAEAVMKCHIYAARAVYGSI